MVDILQAQRGTTHARPPLKAAVARVEVTELKFTKKTRRSLIRTYVVKIYESTLFSSFLLYAGYF